MSIDMDLGYYFSRYEQLMQGVDDIFDKIKKDYPQEVGCDNGCTDCCYALFDLTLIEAIYLNQSFLQLDSEFRNRILIDADKADRKTHKIKRKLFKAHQDGTSDQEILRRAAQERVRCPLLVEDKCVLYSSRPLTCRLYGLPMKLGENTVTCSRSGFEPGGRYPTVDMQKLHDQLMDLSLELARGIGSGFADLHKVLVPVSMALLTEYDSEYLGLDNQEQSSEQEVPTQNKPTQEWAFGPKE